MTVKKLIELRQYYKLKDLCKQADVPYNTIMQKLHREKSRPNSQKLLEKHSNKLDTALKLLKSK